MTILLSSYRCNPFGVSEAYVGFKWLEILLKKHSVILLTIKSNELRIVDYYKKKLPINLHIISFSEIKILKKSHILYNSLKIGYFIFNWQYYRFLKSNSSIVEKSDILFHNTPVSLRFISNLYKFNSKKLIIGPYCGGLQIPSTMKRYFSMEKIAYKMRIFDKYLLKLPMYKHQFKKATKILVSLDYVKDYLPNSCIDKTVTILETGIDCTTNNSIVTKENKITLLFVGRLTRYKGVELLIKSLGFVNKEILNNIELDIVGDGEERDYLENLNRMLGYDSIIHFRGHIKKNDIELYYQKASIFCFPSLTEATGNVLLEAMKYSLPIITINNGGPKYMCPDNGSIKIDIKEETEIIKDLSKAIEKLAVDPKMRVIMGENNRIHCENNYDWKVLQEKIYKIFDDVASSVPQ